MVLLVLAMIRLPQRNAYTHITLLKVSDGQHLIKRLELFALIILIKAS
jgi:hypothetical protein